MNATRTWKVGEIARLTGLTVRTLHHYESIGLLPPSSRGPNGYRMYAEADLQRLQQIASLKSLGFSLEEIMAALKNPRFSPEAVLELHLDALRKEREAQADLEERLKGMLRFLKSRKTVSADDMLQAIALMHRADAAFTPEQHAALKKRRDALGERGMIRAENDWAELIAAVQKHMDAGDDPKGPAMRKLAKKWMSLVNAFTGGDPAMAAKLKKMYEDHPEQSRRFGPDPKMFAYVNKALEHAGLQA